MIDVDVLIVGSGPAGASTALNLTAIDPSWANRILVLDKEVHPREKICGGAVTFLGEKVLRRMGCMPFEPRHVVVREVRIVYRREEVKMRGDPVMRIARRDEMDHWLVCRVLDSGVSVYEGEGVTAIAQKGSHVEVTTSHDTYRAKVVVAADGSKSTVRRLLGLTDPDHVARLLEVLTPVEDTSRHYFDDGVAVFDFSRVTEGLSGYAWDFPSYVNGVARMNRGVYDMNTTASRPSSRGTLKDALDQTLTTRGHDLAALDLVGHPIRLFNPDAPLAHGSILLAGDAAGVDPVLGEGISFALAYGEVAAAAIHHAFTDRAFDFVDYKRRVLAHPLLGQLPSRTRFARALPRIYHPRALNFLAQTMKLIMHGSRWKDRTLDPAARTHRYLNA
jgi:geranylgeranyl reductase family protein